MDQAIIDLSFAGALPLAADKLAFYAKQRLRAPRPVSPDRAWIAPLAGTYRDPALGDVVISATRDGGDLDAGQWHVAIDREVEADGTVTLVVLDPPFAGSAFLVEPGPALTIAGFPGYRFIRRSPCRDSPRRSSDSQ